ncbi:MAG: HIT family protein [Lachnospiraceae bacterium]|nr:HIT family protein [Lachnospiraceae bacterium]
MSDCPYCGAKEAFPYGLYVTSLTMGDVYLFHEQTHPGRCILACKKHVNDMTDLSAEEIAAYFNDAAKLSKALQDLYHPGKVNYGMYNDNGKHLHLHVVPKQEGGPEWGGVFAMNPDQVKWSAEKMKEEAAKIRKALD